MVWFNLGNVGKRSVNELQDIYICINPHDRQNIPHPSLPQGTRFPASVLRNITVLSSSSLICPESQLLPPPLLLHPIYFSAEHFHLEIDIYDFSPDSIFAL